MDDFEIIITPDAEADLLEIRVMNVIYAKRDQLKALKKMHFDNWERQLLMRDRKLPLSVVVFLLLRYYL